MNCVYDDDYIDDSDCKDYKDVNLISYYYKKDTLGIMELK